MIKNIELPKDPINEVYCDVCKELVEITGIPDDEKPVLQKEMSALLSIACGKNSKYEGLFTNIHFCNTCADKLIYLLSEELGLELSSEDAFEGAE
jgi:hypothetical protein